MPRDAVVDHVKQFRAEIAKATNSAMTLSDHDYTQKPSNPKDVIGSGKVPFHLWPETASALGALALEWGMLKYGRGNFRAVGVRASIYYDALRRHVNAWFEGQDNDPESGLPHLAHALACLAVIIESQSEGKFNDDRNYPGGYLELMDAITPDVNRLKTIAQKKGWNPKHYSIADAQAEAAQDEWHFENGPEGEE
jgi:hypothetical protein